MRKQGSGKTGPVTTGPYLRILRQQPVLFQVGDHAVAGSLDGRRVIGGEQFALPGNAGPEDADDPGRAAAQAHIGRIDLQIAGGPDGDLHRARALLAAQGGGGRRPP